MGSGSGGQRRGRARLALLGYVCVLFVSVVYEVNGFLMVRRSEMEDDDYPSLRQLKDLTDFEYAEEAQLQREHSEANPVKRQKNKGGTCTCTCETKPVEEEAANTRPDTAGSLLRTGVGVRPQSAYRVLDKPYQQKSYADDSSAGDHHSKAAKEQPWDYYGIESSKSAHQNLLGAAADDAEKPAPEDTAAAAEVKQPTASSQESFQDSGDQLDAWGHSRDQLDAWGHSRRFPWKHLPNTMCFRESCNRNSDCCMRYNLCDKSAKVCVDCWYGSICRSEQDCCQRFPHCKRPVKPPTPGRLEDLPNGKCVGKE